MLLFPESESTKDAAPWIHWMRSFFAERMNGAEQSIERSRPFSRNYRATCQYHANLARKLSIVDACVPADTGFAGVEVFDNGSTGFVSHRRHDIPGMCQAFISTPAGWGK
jgi:hypothetical protein